MAFQKKRHMKTESDEEQHVVKKSKTGKQGKGNLAHGKDEEGNAYWEIGNNRRIGSSQYKGTTLVNIREFYTTPTGELKPGKKGISLSLDQYKALLKAIPELNEELRSQGHDVGSLPASATSSALVAADKPAKAKKPKRSNIDATSDEEEEDDGE